MQHILVHEPLVRLGTLLPHAPSTHGRWTAQPKRWQKEFHKSPAARTTRFQPRPWSTSRCAALDLQTMQQEDSRTRVHDIAIVGAGVVGAALGAALGRAGRRVLVVERDMSEPDRIVGELLQPGGVRALQMLGLGDTLEGIDAVPTAGYHVFLMPSDSVRFQYPAVDELPPRYGRSTPLGPTGHYEGRSFHHGRFIMALRRALTAQPNVDVVQATVSELVHASEDGRVTGVRTTEGAEYFAPVTIVADGCFSRFRKSYGGAHKPQVRSHFVGLELPPDALVSRYYGHVILNRQPAAEARLPGKARGPSLVYQIGSDATRVLVDVPGPTLPSMSNGALQKYIANEVAPYLPAPVDAAVAAVVAHGGRMRSMPNNFLPPSMQGMLRHQRGLIVVGDAMNMRHPLTGGGMTVAFWDCAYLAHILGTGAWSPLDSSPYAFDVDERARDLHNWSAIQRMLRTWHWRRKNLASVINILAQALYSLFGTPSTSPTPPTYADDTLMVLRMGCFPYFERGGECVRGPVSLLAGLAPDVLLLVYHFFAVAVYSVLLLFTGDLQTKPGSKQHVRPSLPSYPLLAIRAAAVLYTACVVIFPIIWTELWTNIAGTHRTLLIQASLIVAVCSVGAFMSGSYLLA